VSTPGAATVDRVKELLVRALNLSHVRADEIGDDTPLFGEGLGLDSVDALELVVALEKEFGIAADSHEIPREAFASAAALARFVETQTGSPS
jgi:acyl carrier protein